MNPADLQGAPYLRELAKRLRKHAVRMRGWDQQAGKEIGYAAMCLELFAELEMKEREDDDR